MTLRECRQPRICPWKLINSLLGHKVINNCCRDKMFPTIHFLVAWKHFTSSFAGPPLTALQGLQRRQVLFVSF